MHVLARFSGPVDCGGLAFRHFVVCAVDQKQGRGWSLAAGPTAGGAVCCWFVPRVVSSVRRVELLGQGGALRMGCVGRVMPWMRWRCSIPGSCSCKPCAARWGGRWGVRQGGARTSAPEARAPARLLDWRRHLTDEALRVAFDVATQAQTLSLSWQPNATEHVAPTDYPLRCTRERMQLYRVLSLAPLALTYGAPATQPQAQHTPKRLRPPSAPHHIIITSPCLPLPGKGSSSSLLPCSAPPPRLRLLASANRERYGPLYPGWHRAEQGHPGRGLAANPQRRAGARAPHRLPAHQAGRASTCAMPGPVTMPDCNHFACTLPCWGGHARWLTRPSLSLPRPSRRASRPHY